MNRIRRVGCSRLVFGAVVSSLAPTACPWAGGPTPFTEEASQRGLDYEHEFVAGAGRGIAFVDLDGDGDSDLVTVGSADGQVGVFENTGGQFVDVSATTQIPDITFASAVSAADYDGDGDFDLYFANWAAPNMLVENLGGFQFLDVTTTAGVGDDGAGTSGAWGDYDGDGWLDLYVANVTAAHLMERPNRLYHNEGNRTFTEVGSINGLADQNISWQAVFLDFDQDGDADIYVSNDKSAADCVPHNYLFENVEGSFADVTEESGTEACADSMGIAIGDVDVNAHPDIYVTNTPSGNVLLLNQGNGTFSEASEQAGVASYATGWGTILFDYDNDTLLDLYVCNQGAPNRLYTTSGSWPYVDSAAVLNVDVGDASYCVAAADIDNDGDLDMAVQNKGEPIRLFINHEGSQRNWLKLDVVGTGANGHAVGATAQVTASGTLQLREVFAGGSYKSHNEITLHFGMDQAAVADSIQIKWPGGATRTVWNYPTNERWTMYPQEAMGDANGDGQRNFDDFLIFADCQTNAGSGCVTPGCEMMDFDGDAEVDLDDFDAFLQVYGDPLDDCNQNDVIDLLEILTGIANDRNSDGVIDDCDCPGDITDDGVVGSDDLIALIVAWGSASPAADLNHDGIVDAPDLVALIVAWGPCS